MAYDEVLAQRIHDLLDGVAGVTSRKMFGGMGFMVHGHMAVVAVAFQSDEDLQLWVDRGVDFVAGLPPEPS